ncbi:MAG TPA: VOC family protein [Anaerolineales bacterium]|nr:VOC family protein [Anaerolineales bacterium]
MNTLQVSIARHTKNYEAMVGFYRDKLDMDVTLSWDEPGNRGTLLAFGGKASSTVVEVIELGNEAVPGVQPVNVALSIEVDVVDAWHNELLKRNITIARKLEDAPWGHRSFGIDDPDGFRIWYYQDMNPKKSA